MKKQDVLAALSALAQETRLDIFRCLIEAGPAGVPAGQIGAGMGLPLPTLSFHLRTLQQAGLITRQRQSRSLIYAADFGRMNELIGYLTEHCCGGRPERCGLPVAVDTGADAADLAAGPTLNPMALSRR